VHAPGERWVVLVGPSARLQAPCPRVAAWRRHVLRRAPLSFESEACEARERFSGPGARQRTREVQTGVPIVSRRPCRPTVVWGLRARAPSVRVELGAWPVVAERWVYERPVPWSTVSWLFGRHEVADPRRVSWRSPGELGGRIWGRPFSFGPWLLDVDALTDQRRGMFGQLFAPPLALSLVSPSRNPFIPAVLPEAAHFRGKRAPAIILTVCR
jgi:hypothetical protein